MNIDDVAVLTLARGRVLAWVEFYTRGLPRDVGSARREELLADLHDQAVEAASDDIEPARVARAVIIRAVKGFPADLAWRRTQLQLASPLGPIRSGGLLLAAGLGALVMSVLGVVSVLRGLHVGTGRWTGWSADPAFIPLIVGTAAAVCGMLMLGRSRTRLLGALWLAGAAQLLVVPGLNVLSGTSTVLRWATSTEPTLWVCAIAASVGISVIYIAIAVAWLPPLRRVEASR